MRICVVGTGYVGLVAGACFADVGNDVTCVDIAQEKIDALNAGQIPIYEPGLEEIVLRNRHEERLQFTTDVAKGIREHDVIFIAVGTPRGEDGSADLQHVKAVANTIGDNLNAYKVIVDKSTVPIGTADIVREIIAAKSDVPFAVVSNPEFLKEGAAIQDFLKPDRVIIGTEDAEAQKIMSQLYAPFQRTSNRIHFMDVRSAEMTKYAANAMLATRISFMNEIARLCDSVGANVDAVRAGIGSDPRIGRSFLFPGAGFGGSCFPKDLRALIQIGHENDVAMDILRSVVDVNEKQKMRIVERVIECFGDDLSGRTFGIWGLAFKPETDDMREAPSVVIIEALLSRGATVVAHDPIAIDAAKHVLGDRIQYADDNYSAIQNADALILVTEWSQYRSPSFHRLLASMKSPVIFDGRNLYAPEQMKELGFTYYSIGRPSKTI